MKSVGEPSVRRMATGEACSTSTSSTSRRRIRRTQRGAGVHTPSSCRASLMMMSEHSSELLSRPLGTRSVVRRTCCMLGAVHAPLSSVTAAAVDELIAAPSPPEELDAQLHGVRLAMQLGHAVAPIRHRRIRRRLRMLKVAAQPGPSGWRNAHIQSVGMVSGGVQALAKWATMRQGAAVTSPTASLWTAAVVTPVDCGPAVLEEGEAPRRKLRPIVCSGALLKVAESAAIDSVQQELLAAMEPRQMGCGTPDGTGVIVSTVRSWASTALERDGRRHSDPEVFESLDLLNAYGRAFRSACIRVARKRAPSLAPMMAAHPENH